MVSKVLIAVALVITLLVVAMIFVASMAVLSVWHSVMADIVSKLVNAILG